MHPLSDIPDLSIARVYERLLEIEEIGPRFPGSDRERVGRDYVAEQLERNGIDHWFEEFRYSSWAPGSVSVALESPMALDLECAPMTHFAQDTVVGDLVFVGDGSRAAFEMLAAQGVDFEETVVLVLNSAPFTVTPAAQDFGAKGLITISDAPDGLVRRYTGAFYGNTSTAEEMTREPASFPVDIPGATVPFTEGCRLLQLMSAATVRVRLDSHPEYSTGTSWNVVGEILGSERPDETVVFGGHYDTQFAVPGVLDNGSGVASLIEIAQSLQASDLRPERTIRFVSFGCEEIGSWGAVDYSQRHVKGSAERCVGMFNLDSIGSKLVPKHNLWASDPMADFAVEAATNVGWRVDTVERLGTALGDWAPFMDLGVPVAWLGSHRPTHPFYHTERDDTVAHLDLPDLLQTLQVMTLCGTTLGMSDRELRGI